MGVRIKIFVGEWVEVPVMLITPRDVALLLDKFQVLFDRPSVISEGRGVNSTSEALPIEALQELTETTTSKVTTWPFDARSGNEPVAQLRPKLERIQDALSPWDLAGTDQVIEAQHAHVRWSAGRTCPGTTA